MLKGVKGNIQLSDTSHAASGNSLNKKHIDDGRMHIFNIALSNVETISEMDFYVNSKIVEHLLSYVLIEF